MQLKTATAEALNEEPWMTFETSDVLRDTPGIGQMKMLRLVQAAPTAGSLFKLAKSKQLKAIVGPVVEERIKLKLGKLGASFERTKAKAPLKPDVMVDSVMKLAAEGFRLVTTSPEFEMDGLDWKIDLLVESPEGGKVAVVVKRSLDRGSFNEAYAKLKAAQSAGLAESFLILTNLREKAAKVAMAAPFKIRFMDEEME